MDMNQYPGEVDELRAAELLGTTVAVAALSQRDLQECGTTYSSLFPDDPFDVTLFNAVALANAFGAPWLSFKQLRIANRTSLWIFAVDWLIDYKADSRAQVDDVARRILAVADGASPDDPLTRFLADIRDELATAPGYAQWGSAWRDQVERLLVASAREWDWKAARAAGDNSALPSFEEYLDNADNYGSSLVNIGHWIYNGDLAALAHFDELRAAGDEVQRILRLLNDLATYERDLTWGDLNSQMLGVGREQVLARVAELIDNCRKLLEPLRDACPREVTYLERQIGYSLGFYGITDYWGRL
ncbi:terpene synthase family protein [Microbispora sp. NPDC088329]|uniref:terpene synthase family protein n=1 Tax=Microbispora sp. NPDC088329 TaxID=3154869 RepID=UPI00341DE4E9